MSIVRGDARHLPPTAPPTEGTHVMTHHINLGTLTLAPGAHPGRAHGVCLLEAVAWWAEEDHTDRPDCVSPVLAAFGRSLNDVLPDDRRQQLIRFIPLLPGTAGDRHDTARRYLALDWLTRTYTPAWLDLGGLNGPAATLRGHAPITDRAAITSHPLPPPPSSTTPTRPPGGPPSATNSKHSSPQTGSRHD